MPAPKKTQQQKDRTRRLRETRKHRKACKRCLGPLGVRLFREFLNLHGRLPIETTACWAEALAQAFGRKRTALSREPLEEVSLKDLKDSRGQFGGWGSAYLRRNLSIPAADGLQFVTRIIEVTGDTPKPWRAILTVLYEGQFGVIFHDLRRLDTKRQLGDGFIWMLIAQALLRLSTGRQAYIKNKQDDITAVSVVVPIRENGRPVHPVFERAITSQSDHDAANWHIQFFRGLRHATLKTRSIHFQELDRQLRAKSRKVTTVLRSLGKAKTGIRPEKNVDARKLQRHAWLLLFPGVYPSDF